MSLKKNNVQAPKTGWTNETQWGGEELLQYCKTYRLKLSENSASHVGGYKTNFNDSD